MQFDELLHDSGFRAGLVAAAVVVAAVMVTAFVTTRGRRTFNGPFPIGGIALVVAALIALDHARGGVPVNDRLVAGLLILAVGPLAATVARSRLVTILSTAPGAALVAWAASLDNKIGWIPPMVFLV